MKILRTPDERFEAWIDYPFEPNYADLPDGEGGKLRMHYIDEGPRDGHVMLMLHGMPTSSFLYRRMVSPLVDAAIAASRRITSGSGRATRCWMTTGTQSSVTARTAPNSSSSSICKT